MKGARAVWVIKASCSLCHGMDWTWKERREGEKCVEINPRPVSDAWSSFSFLLGLSLPCSIFKMCLGYIVREGSGTSGLLFYYV